MTDYQKEVFKGAGLVLVIPLAILLLVGAVWGIGYAYEQGTIIQKEKKATTIPSWSEDKYELREQAERLLAPQLAEERALGLPYNQRAVDALAREILKDKRESFRRYGRRY